MRRAGIIISMSQIAPKNTIALMRISQAHISSFITINWIMLLTLKSIFFRLFGMQTPAIAL
jgi:predicted amino acid-binding ACT domain protein